MTLEYSIYRSNTAGKHVLIIIRNLRVHTESQIDIDNGGVYKLVSDFDVKINKWDYMTWEIEFRIAEEYLKFLFSHNNHLCVEVEYDE